MSFYGELTSIHLPDLLQNFESHRCCGTLSIENTQQSVFLYFLEGKIAMFARPGRPPLAERLVALGYLTERQLETARTKRRGSKKSLGEVLVAMDVIKEAALAELAGQVLADDVADLVALTSTGRFQFHEGEPPARIFDAEERALRLQLGVSALLLEAARRSDHWAMARKVVPSDSAHYFALPGIELPADIDNPQLAQAMLKRLDGTRSVSEISDEFPISRLEVYSILARLVRERIVSAAEGEELLAVAQRVATSDPKRARTILQRGLASEPHHLGFLACEAQLAERLGDHESASAAVKIIAHLKLQSGARDEAHAALLEAKRMAPNDPAVLERCLALAIEERRKADAIKEGLELVAVYRGPGLHARAREVLERLVKLDPQAAAPQRELARCLVDLGEPQAAIKLLARFGKILIARQEFDVAREFYAEVLEVDANNKDALQALDAIDTQAHQRRRAARRRIVRRAVAICVLALLGYVLTLEGRARVALAEAQQAISREHLIEQRRYRDVVARLEAVAQAHPYTVTTYFELRRQIADLAAKARGELPPTLGSETAH
ncbi:MAG: DUF4388 domain-containing protein [Planctomycetota bacterium]